MKPELWVPVTVFLAVSIPLVLILNALDVGGDYRVWLAIAAGALATGYALNRLAGRAAKAELAARPQQRNGEHA